MKKWLIIGLAASLTDVGMIANAETLFYRIVADTTTSITVWTTTRDLAWTSVTTGGQFSVEATSDLTGGGPTRWAPVATGQTTGTVMSCRAPAPEAPFPGPADAALVLIPAGSYLMGDTLLLDNPYFKTETPAHPVWTSAFYMDVTEVTRAHWDEVIDWATNNGYEFNLAALPETDTNFPIYDVSWYDCAKWCNARSEKEGLQPVYYTDEAWTTIYRTGNADLMNTNVNWMARGYRLPTEAEWEKAARGGLAQNYFPWNSAYTGTPPDTVQYYKTRISDTNANYSDSGSTGTTAVASFAPNGYGLFDMAGNVAEWCWDVWTQYADPAEPELIDPTGPDSGSERAVRGGSMVSQASDLRCAARTTSYAPTVQPYYYLGFRCVRSCR